MVFTEIDKYTMQVLCTLVKLSKNTEAHREHIIQVGQHLGVPKDDTLELFEEVEDFDVIHLSSEEEKFRFVENCFSYMEQNDNPAKSEIRFYDQVIKELGISTRSNT